MSLYALALGLFLLSKASRMIRITYAAVCFLAGMSNLMFLPQMLAPLSAAIGLAVFFHVLPASGSWLPVAIGWPATIAGAALNRMLLYTTGVETQVQISRNATLSALDVFLRGFAAHLFEPLHVLALVWFLACVLIAAVIVRRLVTHEVSHAHRLLFVFCACWVFSDLFCAAAIIGGGSNGLTVLKDYVWTIHYFHAIFFVPLFGLPVLAAWLISPRIPSKTMRGAVWMAAAVILVVPVVHLVGSTPSKSGITSYRPALVQSLDAWASGRGIQYGLAGYWQARTITLLSRTGLRAYAVTGDMHPFLWVENVDWFTKSLEDRSKQPVWKFVVLDDPLFKLSKEAAVAMLGKPSEELHSQDVRVLLY
jgi:hypothetical protein